MTDTPLPFQNFCKVVCCPCQWLIFCWNGVLSDLCSHWGLFACVNREVVICALLDRFLPWPLLQSPSLVGHPCRHAYSGAGDTVAHRADSSGDYHREGDILYSPLVSYTPPSHHTVCGATTMDLAQLGQSQGMGTAFVLGSERPFFSRVILVQRNGKKNSICLDER
jgi:hypothetical protein